MNKREFLGRLRKGLSGLPQDDIEERVAFYGEMIDDRMEEGLSEAEAVLAVGDVDEIIAQIRGEFPQAKKEKAKRKLGAWELGLLLLGAPIWLSLGISAVAVIISLYASLWALVISLWSVFGALAACAVAGVLSCVAFILRGNGIVGMAMLAAGVTCVGFSIFIFLGCKAATKGCVILLKKFMVWVKNCFTGKGEA